MKIFIVEDEELAVKKLKKTLQTVDEDATVVGEADSIKSSVSWLENNPDPDLILMDIELADGQSFEIFNQTQVKSPVIFITSYDEYALKAFKVNSIDYLLKPVQKEARRDRHGQAGPLRALPRGLGRGGPGAAPHEREQFAALVELRLDEPDLERVEQAAVAAAVEAQV